MKMQRKDLERRIKEQKKYGGPLPTLEPSQPQDTSYRRNPFEIDWGYQTRNMNDVDTEHPDYYTHHYG